MTTIIEAVVVAAIVLAIALHTGSIFLFCVIVSVLYGMYPFIRLLAEKARQMKATRGHDVEALRHAMRPKDITLDDLNELLGRIGRGEEPVRDMPLLSVNDARELIADDEGRADQAPVGCDRHQQQRTTFYSDNVMYITIRDVPKPYGTVERR